MKMMKFDFNIFQGLPSFKFSKASMILMSSALFAMGCSNKESALAKQIQFSASGPEYVLPTNLTNTETVKYTCIETGTVKGPRVRVRKISINWTGEGKLLPLVIRWKSTDSRLEVSEFTSVLTPQSGTLAASFFGQANDYIDEGVGLVSNEDSGTPGTSLGSRCYFDMGDLPKLKKPPTGSSTVTIRGKLTLSAVQEADDGTQTPVIKETDLDIIFFEGSVPLD